MNDTILVVTQLMVMPYIAIASISNKFQRGKYVAGCVAPSFVTRLSFYGHAKPKSAHIKIIAEKNRRKVEEEKVLFFRSRGHYSFLNIISFVYIVCTGYTVVTDKHTRCVKCLRSLFRQTSTNR